MRKIFIVFESFEARNAWMGQSKVSVLKVYDKDPQLHVMLTDEEFDKLSKEKGITIHPDPTLVTMAEQSHWVTNEMERAKIKALQGVVEDLTEVSEGLNQET